MDFGIARLQSSDITGSGGIVGTPTYMAPEQITNGPITQTTDLFAVGCLLYELLSYRKPFDGETVHGVLYQVPPTDPRPLRPMAPSLPAALERVVAKAMNKVPEDRYETARQLQAAVTSIRAALSGASEPTTRMALHWTPIPAAALRLVTHAPLKWRALVLSALALVAAVLFWTSPPSSPGTAPAPPDGGLTSATVEQLIAYPLPAGLNSALTAQRDSALAARERAHRAGAMKNNVPSLLLAETVLQNAERALRAGDQPHAATGYLSAVEQYPKAQREADALRREAQQAVARATPGVHALATRPQARGAPRPGPASGSGGLGGGGPGGPPPGGPCTRMARGGGGPRGGAGSAKPSGSPSPRKAGGAPTSGTCASRSVPGPLGRGRRGGDGHRVGPRGGRPDAPQRHRLLQVPPRKRQPVALELHAVDLPDAVAQRDPQTVADDAPARHLLAELRGAVAPYDDVADLVLGLRLPLALDTKGGATLAVEPDGQRHQACDQPGGSRHEQASKGKVSEAAASQDIYPGQGRQVTSHRAAPIRGACARRAARRFAAPTAASFARSPRPARGRIPFRPDPAGKRGPAPAATHPGTAGSCGARRTRRTRAPACWRGGSRAGR